MRRLTASCASSSRLSRSQPASRYLDQGQAWLLPELGSDYEDDISSSSLSGRVRGHFGGSVGHSALFNSFRSRGKVSRPTCATSTPHQSYYPWSVRPDDGIECVDKLGIFTPALCVYVNDLDAHLERVRLLGGLIIDSPWRLISGHGSNTRPTQRGTSRRSEPTV